MSIRKSAESRKLEIVDATLRLADELGPDRLTTGAVADAVGLTQPAIFRHFPTKQALWEAVAFSVGARMADAWDRVLSEDLGTEQRLEGLIRAQLRMIAAHPAIPAILFSRELQVENAALRQSFGGLMARFHALLAEELAQGQRTGIFRVDIRPQDAAVLLLSLVQGLAIRWSLGARAFDLEAEGARLLAVQLQMFRKEPEKEMPR